MTLSSVLREPLSVKGEGGLVWGQHSLLRHIGAVLSLSGASGRASFQGIDAQPSLPPGESQAPATGGVSAEAAVAAPVV